MAGLLDFVKTPEGQGLLAAAFGGLAGARRGQPLNSLGRAGLAGMQGYTNAQDRVAQEGDAAFQKQFKTAQLKKIEQDLADSQKKSLFLDSLANPETAALSAGAAVGDVGPTVSNAARVPSMSKLPADALRADVALNGGKNVSDWLFKMGAPDMQVSGGYAYDKNSVKPGYMPQLSVSNDGKATQVSIDPMGQPLVQAPRGAVKTFGEYRGIDESTKAAYDPMPVTTPDGRTTLTTRGAVVGGVNPSGRGSSGYAGGSADAAATGQRDILQRELEKAKAQGNAVDVAALERELGRLPGGSGVQGIAIQSDAEKLGAAKDVEAKAAARAARAKDLKTADRFMAVAKDAKALLDQNPTASGFGSLLDAAAGSIGFTTKGAETADQLKALGGWLVANVPRMEGPQSNFDVENYRTMAANVANDRLPVARRKAALESVMKMFSDIQNGDGGATASFGDQPQKTVKRTGIYGGKKVIEYTDGSVEYAN